MQTFDKTVSVDGVPPTLFGLCLKAIVTHASTSRRLLTLTLTLSSSPSPAPLSAPQNLYVSLSTSLLGQSYPLPLVPTSGLYCTSTLVRVLNKSWKEPSASDASKDIGSLIKSSQETKYKSEWQLGLAVVSVPSSGAPVATASLSASQVDSVLLSPPPSLSNLLELWKLVKSTTSYSTVSLLPAPTFDSSVPVTKHKDVKQKREVRRRGPHGRDREEGEEPAS